MNNFTIIPGPELPWNSSAHCLLEFNSTHILMMGGFKSSDQDTPKSVYYYDWNRQEWSRGPDMLFEHQGHACAKFEDKHGDTKIIVMGGFDSSKTEVFNGKEWKQVANTPSTTFSIFSTAITYLDSVIYSETEYIEREGFAWKYNITEDKWERFFKLQTNNRMNIPAIVDKKFCKKPKNDEN